jgi:transcriptional regulator with XRE-family HTH domain
MSSAASIIRHAREAAGLSQRELAERAGTSQPAIARAEAGRGTLTLSTLERLVAATGSRLEWVVASPPNDDQVTAAFRRDVDRSLLRQNLTRSIDERLASGAALVDATNELARATREARRRRHRS